MFYKIDVPKNFVKFTGKHLVPGSLFKKVVGLQLATLLEKRAGDR